MTKAEGKVLGKNMCRNSPSAKAIGFSETQADALGGCVSRKHNGGRIPDLSGIQLQFGGAVLVKTQLLTVSADETRTFNAGLIALACSYRLRWGERNSDIDLDAANSAEKITRSVLATALWLGAYREAPSFSSPSGWAMPFLIASSSSSFMARVAF